MNFAPRMVFLRWYVVGSSVLFGALSFAACGGSAPPPEAPPPSLEDPAPNAATEQGEKPSSKQVEQGIDAIKAQDFAKAKTLVFNLHSNL